MVVPELLRLNTPPLWSDLSSEASDPSVFFFFCCFGGGGSSRIKQSKACFLFPVCLRNLSSKKMRLFYGDRHIGQCFSTRHPRPKERFCRNDNDSVTILLVGEFRGMLGIFFFRGRGQVEIASGHW